MKVRDGETRRRAPRAEGRERLPVSQPVPQTLIPRVPFAASSLRARDVYLRGKSIHNENPPAIPLSIVHRSAPHTRSAATYVSATAPSEAQRRFSPLPYPAPFPLRSDGPPVAAPLPSTCAARSSRFSSSLFLSLSLLSRDRDSDSCRARAYTSPSCHAAR